MLTDGQPTDQFGSETLQRAVIAIDGGGTKTQALLADLSGTIIFSAHGGPTNPASVGMEAAIINFGEVLSQLLTIPVQVETVVLGLAGIDSELDRKQFFSAAFNVLSARKLTGVYIVNDAEIALANGTDAPNSIVLIAGTGSVCYGHNAEGQTHRAGGMDYLMSDEGSGYWIGRKILRSVVRADDGRGRPTALSKLVFDYFGLHSIDELKQKIYNPPLNKLQISSLAKLWDTALAMDDAVALSLVDRVVDELELLVTAVARALQLQNDQFDLVVSGSIALHRVVEQQLRARLQQTYPLMNVVIPTTPPVYGALKIAIQRESLLQAV